MIIVLATGESRNGSARKSRVINTSALALDSAGCERLTTQRHDRDKLSLSENNDRYCLFALLCRLFVCLSTGLHYRPTGRQPVVASYSVLPAASCLRRYLTGILAAGDDDDDDKRAKSALCRLVSPSAVPYGPCCKRASENDTTKTTTTTKFVRMLLNLPAAASASVGPASPADCDATCRRRRRRCCRCVARRRTRPLFKDSRSGGDGEERQK